MEARVGWKGPLTRGNGFVVEQLRCSWACGLEDTLVGASSNSPHIRSAAVSCLLSGGPWPGLGCCFSWPSGVQPCPQVSSLSVSPSVPQLVGPNLFPYSGLPVCGWDAGMKDRGTWGPPGESLTRRPSSLPYCTLPPSYWGPKSSSPGVHGVGREDSHLLEV